MEIPVTSMADVARAAGVSVATVSRVLSGKSGVRAETAGRIRAAADDLNYTYNSVAASLRRQRTMLVGICVPQVTNPFFAALIEGLENEVAHLGFDVLVADAQEDPAIELTRVASLLERQIDALVVVPTGGDELAALLGGRTPCVVVDRELPSLSADWVGVDHRSGIEQVIGHLRTRGHERLGFLGAGSTNTAAAERLDAFRQAADGPTLEGDFTLGWGRIGAARLREQYPVITAIVCANDMIAYGAMAWAREQGLSIPGDLAITGFDDLPFSQLIEPSLTTVRQPLERITLVVSSYLRRALLQAPDEVRFSKAAPERHVVPAELIVRGSA